MLRSEMHNYVRRFTSLLRQTLSLDYGAESPMGLTLAGLKSSPQNVRNDWLDALGQRLSTAEVRLPSSGLRWTQRDRQEMEGSEVDWQIRPQSRLEAAMRRAEAEAFVISEDRLLARLDTKAQGRTLRLSDLAAHQADEVLTTLHAVGAIRSMQGRTGWEARKLPFQFETPTFVADDYELRPHSSTDEMQPAQRSLPAVEPDLDPAINR
ncbi:MAG: hypothetical protein JWL63_1798 [Rhodocyclales bacterium]|nr:hypothetical protein [Rhodocyclales bacterium]